MQLGTFGYSASTLTPPHPNLPKLSYTYHYGTADLHRRNSWEKTAVRMIHVYVAVLIWYLNFNFDIIIDTYV